MKTNKGNIKHKGEIKVDEEQTQDNVQKQIDKQKREREIILYRLAKDISTMEVNHAEAQSYAQTANSMKDDETRTAQDGVTYDKSYYVTRHFQFWWYAKNAQIEINRLMIERNITIDELNEFRNKTYGFNKSDEQT